LNQLFCHGRHLSLCLFSSGGKSAGEQKSQTNPDSPPMLSPSAAATLGRLKHRPTSLTTDCKGHARRRHFGG
jgi:hypothetical protein